MTQHHTSKDPNFQAPEYQNIIAMEAQNYKRNFLIGNDTIWEDIWYNYVTADSN